MRYTSTFNIIYNKLLSTRTKAQSEKVILTIAIASFIIHLTIIYLVDFGIIPLTEPNDLLSSPIAAIYTPFSFILVYEVYLLIHYLPKSITTYIGKQYEIITLIIIRRLFKDLSNISLSTDWFTSAYDLQLTYDLVASVLLFFLIFLFNTQNKGTLNQPTILTPEHEKSIQRFIKIKKIIATILVPILILVALYSLGSWLASATHISGAKEVSIKNINNIFFEQFFTILIIADVVLLLFSLFHTDDFHKVIRNSGFIISTILIRLSFGVTGLLNTALIVIAILFGLLILVIHNLYQKKAIEQHLANP